MKPIMTTLLLLCAGATFWGQTPKVDGTTRSPFFDQYEVLYTAGSPLGTSEWRNIDNTVYTNLFTQMVQVSALHQFKGRELGAATAGYRYPAIGFYLQWLDYSHLRMHGKEPLVPASKKYSYGHIASAGLVLHQTCWTNGPWSGHIKMQDGAAYVFDPVYEKYGKEVIATMAKPWQFLLGVGWYFDREVGQHGVLSFGPQFTHMSNSGLGEYNTGINNFTFSLAYRYQVHRNQPICAPEEALLEKDGSTFRPHLYYSCMAGLGGVFFEYSQKANGQLTAMADVMYRLSPTHGLGMGIDYYHCAQPDRCHRTDYVGMGVKYDHWWGGFVFHVQGGVYLNDRRPIKWKGMSRFYENIGYKYVFCRTRQVAPYIGVYTKGNGFNAEQMAFSLGCMLH
ncbi:MAG: acyloxyacyl hydrolase [Bacteroidales bacterium]|nr:acyloxyacyl hydrolase [Bacteroidales bacterium]